MAQQPKQGLHWSRLFLLIAAGGVVVYVLWQLKGLVQVMIVSALLAYLLDPATRRIETYGLSRTAATSIVFFATLLVFGLAFVFLSPLAARQFVDFDMAAIIASATDVIGQIEDFLASAAGFLSIPGLGEDISLQDRMSTFFSGSLSFLPGILQVLGNMLLAPFIMFFLLKDARSMKHGFISIVPNRYFEFSLNLIEKMDNQLGAYLRGQFMIALVVGALSTIALAILQVDYYLVIGPIAGFCNLIPWVGPVSGILLASISDILVTGSFETVPWIVLSFVAIQIIDQILLEPLILAKNVSLHPLTVALVLIIGAKFFGFIGLLLGVPATAILKVVFQEVINNARRYQLSPESTLSEALS